MVRLGAPALAACVLLAACELTHQQQVGAPAPTQSAPAPAAAQPVPAPVAAAMPPENLGLAEFHQTIEPILRANCYECHGDGKSEAGIAFDKLTTEDQILKNPGLWLKVIKNTRAGLMPADGNPRLSAKDQATLDHWIKFAAFGVDQQNFDPGRVTAHRLNRIEYRNTIRDLLGVSFDTDAAFPSDDIGYGFDNIADVLNVSPLLLEKYLAAAQTVVGQAVPSASRVAPQTSVLGRSFVDDATGRTPALDTATLENGVAPRTAVKTSYFKAAKFTHVFPIAVEGDYKVTVERGVSSNFTYVPQTCTVTIIVDGKELKQSVLQWHGANSSSERQFSTYDTVAVHWAPGDHKLTVSVTPLSGVSDGRHDASFLLRSATIEGPGDPKYWAHPSGYARFFPRDDAPADPAGRRAYARELLGAFATKAFRRPVPDDSLDKLVNIAEQIYTQPGKTFEAGVSQGMVAVLASPRFLFRIDTPDAPAGTPAPFARVDEYSLASRLSYFLWSTMPDDALLKLAAAGQLRTSLAAQVRRLVADPRADNFINSFSGQWLQSRAVTNVPINAHEIMLREDFDAPATYDLTPEQRAALEAEAQAYFGYVLRDDRSVDEFIASDYTFLNSTLATYYFDGKYELQGDEMRKVALSAGNWRGGILTLGSVLMISSNPTRTSPVKRGKWILENILDAPAPPPPANIPPLEAAGKDISGHTPSMREILAKHRADPNCSSCHDRMDPLGLALENFNALGTWRDKDMQQPVDATGKLITGETFKDIRELKQILLNNHRDEFYRCLTQKLLTYALGRGVDYYDLPTVDKIVENMDKDGGKFSALLMGVIDSAAFQEERLQPDSSPAVPAKPAALLSQNTLRP